MEDHDILSTKSFTMPLAHVTVKATFITLPDGAAWIVDEGPDHIWYKFSPDNTVLTIGGVGAMPDYTSTAQGDRPYNSFKALSTSLIIEPGVTRIGNYAFYFGNKLISISIPDGVTSIGEYAFGGCPALKSVAFSASHVAIGKSAFSNCAAIASLSIDSVEAWCSNTFADTYSNPFAKSTASKTLYVNGVATTDPVIPATVTSIPAYAFCNWTNLTSVTMKAKTPPTLASNSFTSATGIVNIYVPSGSENHYKTAANWKSLASKIVPAYTVSVIADQGTVTVDKASFPAADYTEVNETVTVTVTPADGCVLRSLTATYVDGDGQTQTLVLTQDELDATKYTFPMPLANVTVKATHDSGITIYEVTSLDPWDPAKGRINVDYALDKIGATAEYEVRFEITANGKTVTVTNAAQTLTNGDQTIKVIDTIAKFGMEVTDGKAKMKIFLVFDGETVATAEATFNLGPARIPTVAKPDDATWLVNDGENQIWYQLTESNTVLTLGGFGAMRDFSSSSKQPWSDSRSTVTTIIIEPGITYIGNYGFSDCSAVTSISIPSSVTGIGKQAFYLGTSGSTLTMTVKAKTPPTFGQNALRGSVIKTIYVPNGCEQAYQGDSTLNSLSVSSKIKPAYVVDVLFAENGRIGWSKDCFPVATYTEANETVTLTVTPDIGCVLQSLTATYVDGDGQKQRLVLTQDELDATKYTFPMPLANVTVKATFKDTTEYTGISVTLDSDIFLNFYMSLTDAIAESGTMQFDIGGRTVEDVTVRKNANGYYFSCPVNVLEMTETVTATFTFNGKEYVESYSVAEYLDHIVNGTDDDGNAYPDELKVLACKIANYGHYAQTYLAGIHSSVTIGSDGYAATQKYTDNAMDVALDTAKAALLAEAANFVSPEATTSFALYGRTVEFDSAMALNFYVKVKDGSIEKVVVTGGKNATVTLYRDNIYIVSVKDIKATEFGTDFTVTINDEFAITGSVLEYCGSVVAAHTGDSDRDQAAVNAMAAFYEYYAAVENYVD